uniref:Zgc:77112 n=1 Tax=Neogobius melanostomus TaxID=47308 RepID=A0A8C6WEP7_9GOBI
MAPSILDVCFYINSISGCVFVSSVLPVANIGSMAHSAGLVEIAVRLCLNQNKQLCPHLWVPILKPLRPCIRPQVSPKTFNQSNKRVMFADTKGLSLTNVRMISDRDEQSDLAVLPSFQGLSLTEDSYSCTVSTCCPGTQLKLGFSQPSADFQVFRAKLEKSFVILENCSLADQALHGILRVKNICFQKDVHVRITFDSWYSFREVPCTYVPKRFGGPQTDVFEFDVAIPKVLDAKRKIEFCLKYLPREHSEPFWDNNDGQNYSILVDVNSHLCQRISGPSWHWLWSDS